MVQPTMTSFFFVCPLPLDALDALDQQGHRDQDYGDIINVEVVLPIVNPIPLYIMVTTTRLM